MIKRRFCLFVFLVVFASCSQYPSDPSTSTSGAGIRLASQPKNIILMIGDGMGIAQITAGMYANGNHLNLEQFPVVGIHKPYAINNLITDSAAGATAMASGVKTNNGAIGVDPDNRPVPTILEEAEIHGLATGLISTSSITHATPAAFIAHVPQRKMMEEIAEAFTQTEIDLFIGGGKKYFYQREKDQLNLLNILEKRGYYLSDYTKEPLTEIVLDFNKNLGYFTAESEPASYDEGRDYLVPACQLAAVFLRNRGEKGFFLMVEAAQIDWGGHENNSEYMISEMIEFDKAIGEMLKFAREDSETLLIVTSDHETGGYSINPGSRMDNLIGAFTTDYHTGALIPVFAYGPGAELFNGIYENTALYEKMKQALGFDKKS